ncbi:hypothetical protein QEV63_05895 [Trueperella pyogenes]
MVELNGGYAAMLCNDTGDVAERGHIGVFVKAQAVVGDASLRDDCGGFDRHEAETAQ